MSSGTVHDFGSMGFGQPWPARCGARSIGRAAAQVGATTNPATTVATVKLRRIERVILIQNAPRAGRIEPVYRIGGAVRAAWRAVVHSVPMRAAVVGHVEWVEFIRVGHVPASGEILHATKWWEEPGGGGAGAAVQLAKLAGAVSFFTALGDDDRGRRARRALEGHGVTVHAASRAEPTRRAVTHVDSSGERTITVLGHRLAPSAADPLPWDELDGADAVYFTAGDSGALAAARRANVLVATARVLPVLRAARIRLDALVGSADDASEAFSEDDLDPRPTLCVWTEGETGGSFLHGHERGRYAAAPAPLVVDRYGAGDSFAAGLTYALGRGLDVRAALGVAARCGAAVVGGAGPYAGQLRADDL